jgi:hypothetical protein
MQLCRSHKANWSFSSLGDLLGVSSSQQKQDFEVNADENDSDEEVDAALHDIGESLSDNGEQSKRQRLS